MEISIDKYVGEQLELLRLEIEKGENIVMSAPTGSGKTTAICDLTNILTNKRIVFAMPVRPLVENVKEKFPKEKYPSLVCGYGYDFYLRNKSAKFTCTVYDTATKYADNCDILFVDEAHLFGGHGEFRKEVLVELLKFKCQIVLISGTPELIEYLPEFKKICFTKTLNRRDVKVQISQESTECIIRGIIDKRDSFNQTIIRVNNKSVIDNICEYYSDDIKIDKLYSDKEEVLLACQDAEVIREIKKGVIPFDREVLLTTSIIDAGLSLSVSKDVDAFIIDDRFMPNAIDTAQFSARVREESGHIMNLTIIGRGFGDIEDTTLVMNQKQQSSQFIDQMSGAYKWYSQLTEECYYGYLQSCGLFCNRVLSPYIEQREKISNVRDITILNNLNDLPVFSKIQKELIAKGREDEICLFEGKKKFKGNKNSSNIMRLAGYITEAIKYDIQFDWFIRDKFYEDKIKNLLSAIDNIRKSANFAELAYTLIEAVLSGGKVQKISLAQYNEFDKTMKESFNELNRLVNNNGQIRTKKSHKVESKELVPELETFLYRLLNINTAKAS